MWRFCFHPTSSNCSMSFLLLEITWCDVWAIGWHALFCVRVYWLFWRYIWFVNSWKSLLNWGATACVVLILELRWVLLASFWHCWSFQRYDSSNSWYGTCELFIFIAVYSYARRTDLFGESSEMELRFYDVILGMDWLSRHQVVLDCLRERVDIAGADGSFYCMHATCSRVIEYKSREIFGDHFDA